MLAEATLAKALKSQTLEYTAPDQKKVSENIEILHGQIVRDDARVLADAFILVD